MKSYLFLLMCCLPLTLATEAALREFTSGNNLFTTSLYKQITAGQQGNFLVSPVSIETILALTQSGAKDATAEEIRTALHLPASQEQVQAAVQTLNPLLRKDDPYTLQSANKIYLKNDFEVKDGFKKAAAVFDTEFENINFDERKAAVGTMNKWVEGRTNSKIQNLVSENDVNDGTRAILINALYFKANWSSPFERYGTFMQDFYPGGEQKVQVDTMHDTGYQNYYESEELGAQFLELPFEGDDVTLTVVLPKERNGLSALEGRLEKVFDAPSYTKENVRIALPKFKVESLVDVKAILQKLGVNKVFRDDEADLSGIAGEKGDLIVDQAKQKAFIDVSENGVEAAAATYVAVGVPLSGIVHSVPPKEFVADHPFVFYIKVKDLVIFAGRVVNPSQ